MLRGESHVCFLQSVRSLESVHVLYLDIVKILAGFLDHGLVCSPVNDENQSVVVFNGLYCTFSGEGVLDNCVLVPGLFFLHALSGILWSSGEFLGHWSSEGNLSPHSVLSLGVSAFLDCS